VHSKRKVKILVTIPHYFNAHGDGKYVSTSSNPAPRIEACRACITALHRLFGSPQYQLDIAAWNAVPVNQPATHELDLVLCTTRGDHLIDQLGLPEAAYRHCAFEVEPMMLAFECQQVLKDAIGKYDYYCFLEDDLVIHDPFFLRKLTWFHRQFGDQCLLQPNRFELGGLDAAVAKLYIDGNLPPRSTARFQNIAQSPDLMLPYLDATSRLCRALNPHSGCYFLTGFQMTHWAEQPHFLDRDVSWCGPLESAATLGIMKTFRLYKPARENMDFLEVEHRSTYNLNLIGKDVPVASRAGRMSRLVTKLPFSLNPFQPL
jgi:hypothetical protein